MADNPHLAQGRCTSSYMQSSAVEGDWNAAWIMVGTAWETMSFPNVTNCPNESNDLYFSQVMVNHLKDPESLWICITHLKSGTVFVDVCCIQWFLAFLVSKICLLLVAPPIGSEKDPSSGLRRAWRETSNLPNKTNQQGPGVWDMPKLYTLRCHQNGWEIHDRNGHWNAEKSSN